MVFSNVEGIEICPNERPKLLFGFRMGMIAGFHMCGMMLIAGVYSCVR